ncbi:MAG TPA: UDP-N-acetylmuramate--L-alanine ligase, partial [Thermoleophilaceae bacterium]|nr:UDP-N-acetylmuramate--L-alanine ligase [Thermoleophilaceae bacterium]
VPEGAEVVVSTAIADDNPELAAARGGGLTVLHRGELLGEVSRLKRCLAVAGTHGKTTTTSMAAHALVHCGRRPAYLVGGEVRSTGTNASWGQGDWVVIEADESDRSFLRLRPDVAVVTNVELDHHTTYRTLPEVEEAFAGFAGGAPTVIAPAGLELQGVPPSVTFGIGTGTLAARDLELTPGGSRFLVEGVEVILRVPGRHNVLNALAALAACREAGLALENAAPALAGFSGAGRRFEPHGRTATGALVYDDYAHHPTEVRATLEAARSLEPRRLVAVFQPHLYSRTQRMAREFGRALSLADLVVVLELYPARERAEDFPGVSGYAVAAAAASAANGRRVYWLPQMDDAERFLRGELREGDLLLTLGAGDVDKLARRLGDGT